MCSTAQLSFSGSRDGRDLFIAMMLRSSSASQSRKSNSSSTMTTSNKVHSLAPPASRAKFWKLTSVVLGVLLARDYISYFQSWLSNSGECVYSFGTYKGHQYTAKETVGTPKCWLESKWMRIQQHAVQFAGQSKPIPDWLWIDYHDRINVLVEAPPEKSSKERQFYIFEQSKYALEGRISKAIIGGIIEPGERPEIAAQREIEEEMHLKCEELHFLGRFRTDVNRGMGWVNSFLAAHCIPIVKRKSPDETSDQVGAQVGAEDFERQDLKKLSLSEVRAAVTKGEFIEVQWSNTVALALQHPELANGGLK